MARHSHSHSHSHSPSSPQSPLNSSSNLNASTSTSSYNPHPTLSNSTLSPASLTPAQPTLSLAHARRSINNNQFSPNPSNSSPPSISHSSSTISNANSRKVSNQSQPEDPFANDKPDQGIDKDFHLHSDFSTNSENPGNVLVKVQGVYFYVHKDILFFASPFFKSILEGGWAESHEISVAGGEDLEDEASQDEEEILDENQETLDANDEEDDKEHLETKISNRRSSSRAGQSKSESRTTTANHSSSDSDSDISSPTSPPLLGHDSSSHDSDNTRETHGMERDHRASDDAGSSIHHSRTRSRVRASFHTAHFSLDASDPSADERFHQFLEKRRSDETDAVLEHHPENESMRGSHGDRKGKGKAKDQSQLQDSSLDDEEIGRKAAETEKTLNRLIGHQNDGDPLESSSNLGDQDHKEIKLKSRRRSASEGESSLHSEAFRKSLGLSSPKGKGQGGHPNLSIDGDPKIPDLDSLATPPQSPSFKSSNLSKDYKLSSPSGEPSDPSKVEASASIIEEKSKLLSKSSPSPSTKKDSSNHGSISKKKKKLVELGKQKWEGSVKKTKSTHQKNLGEKVSLADLSSPASAPVKLREDSRRKKSTIKEQESGLDDVDEPQQKFLASRSVSDPVLLGKASKSSSKGKKMKVKNQLQALDHPSVQTRLSQQGFIRQSRSSTGRRDASLPLVAVIELHEEEASTFQDFLFHIYPHLDGLVTWKSVQGLMRFGDKFEVPFLRKNCLNFLKQSLAGRPIHAMCLAEEFGLDFIYREASRHVLDNYSNWSNEELDELSRESLIKIERKRSWFLERVLKLSTSNPGRDFECQLNCPDSTACSKSLHEKFRSAYVTAFRFGPPRPSEIWRLLREFDSTTSTGQSSGSGLHSCLLHSKAWVRLLFDRMFEINQTGGTNTRLFLSIKLESGNGGGGKKV